METQIDRKKVNALVNQLWTLHDQALDSGNTQKANDYAAQAFELLEALPENTVYLQVRQ